MQYFVTGATGFIGKRLVKTLLARSGADRPLPAAARERGQGRRRCSSTGASSKARAVPVYGDLTSKKLGVAADDVKALKGQIDHLYHLAAVYDLSADEESQVKVNIEGTRSAVEFAKAIDARHFHHVSSIAAAGLYEGVFREDMFDEAEGLDHPYFMTKHESEKIVRKECKVPWTVYRPAMVVGDSKTGEMDKVDGPYYFFKLIQRMRQILPPWMPQHRPRGRAREHRAGGLRRRRARPHQPPLPRQRQVLPPGRPGGLPRRRRARHLQQGRARAEDEPVRQRRAVRLHPEEREEGPDGAGAGAAHPQRRDQGPRRARGHADLRQLPDALRPPRDRRGAEGQRHRVPEPERLRLAAVGLLGAPPRPGAVHRPLVARHRRRQGGADHRRLVGHRPVGGVPLRRSRCDHRHLRPRRRQAGRGGEGDQGGGRQGRHGLQLCGGHRRRSRAAPSSSRS